MEGNYAVNLIRTAGSNPLNATKLTLSLRGMGGTETGTFTTDVSSAKRPIAELSLTSIDSTRGHGTLKNANKQNMQQRPNRRNNRGRLGRAVRPVKMAKLGRMKRLPKNGTSRFVIRMPRAGVEPAHLSARDFKSLVSANSTTWAQKKCYHTQQEGGQRPPSCFDLEAL